MRAQKDPVCPNCKGTGKVRAEDVAKTAQKDPVCPSCKGTGKVRAEDDAAFITDTEGQPGGHQ
jgi:DnaJ-class molecular chaperone